MLGNTAVLAEMHTLSVATLNDAGQERRNTGLQRFTCNFLTKLEILQRRLSKERTRCDEEHKAKEYSLQSTSMNWVSPTAVVGAWVEPVDKDNTRVTVVIKRKMTTDFATTLTESTFHDRFAQAVDIIRAGKLLPVKSP